MKPIAYVLTGLPCSGKSFFRCNPENFRVGDYFTYSTDDEIEDYAESIGSTYSQVFNEYYNTALSIQNAKLDVAIKDHKNIIFDQTNMDSYKRKSIVSKLEDYATFSITFLPPMNPYEMEIYLRRMDEREKKVPLSVVNSMMQKFSIPQPLEGFHHYLLYSSYSGKYMYYSMNDLFNGFMYAMEEFSKLNALEELTNG